MPLQPCSFFPHGICAKGATCGFLHDNAVLSDHMKIAMALRDFALSRGSSIHASKLGEFYQNQRDAKQVVGGHVRTFCEMFPCLLDFEQNSGAGIIKGIPVNEGAQRLKGRIANQAGKSQSALDDNESAVIALNLASFILKKGGSIESRQIAEFYASNPEARPCLTAGIRSFCERHSSFLRFEGTGGPGRIHAKVQASEGGTTNSTSGNEAAMALKSVLLASGGAMNAGTALAKFYANHPEFRGSIGKPEAFCSKHPHLLSFEPDGASGKLVPVASISKETVHSSSRSQHEVAKLLAEFVKSFDKPMKCPGLMSEFYKKHPDCKPAFKIGLQKFCEAHSNLLQIDDGNLICPMQVSTSSSASGHRAGEALSRTAQMKQVTLAWKRYLDAGRQHLLQGERDALAEEFESFLIKEDIHSVATLPINFNHVMTAFLKIQGKEKSASPNAQLQTSSTHTEATSSSNTQAQLDEACDSVHVELGTEDVQDSILKNDSDQQSTLEENVGTSVTTSVDKMVKDSSPGTICPVEDPWKDGSDPWSCKQLERSLVEQAARSGLISSQVSVESDQNGPNSMQKSQDKITETKTSLPTNDVTSGPQQPDMSDSHSLGILPNRGRVDHLSQPLVIATSTISKEKVRDSNIAWHGWKSLATLNGEEKQEFTTSCSPTFGHGDRSPGGASHPTAASHRTDLRREVLEPRLATKVEHEISGLELGSTASVKASVLQTSNTLQAAVSRLEAWENRLVAKEAELAAREAELTARETFITAFMDREEQRTKVQAARERVAEAVAAETQKAGDFEKVILRPVEPN